ncbi:MAG: SIR2 family protein [Gammaproteobacteria bacterium]|nr:SIR2 family protein [Gammaproteobacteria bacterium]
MVDLRQILSQGRKRIAFLIGAGAPVSIRINTEGRIDENGNPLIPNVAQLTDLVVNKLEESDKRVITALFPKIGDAVNIETILTRIRRLSEAIGTEQIHGNNGAEYADLANRICHEIGEIVSCPLPDEPNPYGELATWIGGTHRDHPVEIFTPNYDLLLEEAFEKARLPYFDGFSGSHHPFFDPTTISNDSLPARWSRLWKIHGSLGWDVQDADIIRTGSRDATSLIYPDHLKYDQIEKQPYSAMFERLKTFLNTPYSILLCSCFSFSDAHIAAVLDEALASNSHTAVLAFQFNSLAEEASAKQLAFRRPNLSVYASDGGVICGIEGKWQLGQPPTDEWVSIRNMFWDASDDENGRFLLGDFAKLARFVALTQAENLIASAMGSPDTSAQLTPVGANYGESPVQRRDGPDRAQP